MRLTKTWLSYIVWGIFSIVFFADIGIAAIEIYQNNGTQEFLIPVVTMYACAIVGIVLCIVLYKLYEKFILPNMDGEMPVLQGALEIFAFVLFLFVAISVRIIAIISAAKEPAGITDFYEYAISTSGGELSNIYSNGVYIYCGLLKFILSFLGHIPSAAMAVQAGIQIITIVVMYLAVKKAVGRLPAWICSALLAFLPGSFFGVRVCTPDALYTLFFSLFLLALVYLCEANREEKIRLTVQSGFYVAIGVFVAFLSYYDIVGLIAVIITIVALAQFRNEDAWMSIQRPWLQILLFLLSFIFSLILMLWFLPCNGLEVGPEAVLGYFKCFVPDAGFNLMILPPHKGQWDSLVLFIMSGIWFVGFLRSKRDKAFPYALMIVVMTICSFFGIGTYEYTGLVSFAWIMLATIGITSLRVFCKNAKEDVVPERGKKQKEVVKAENERNITNTFVEKGVRSDKMAKKTENTEIVLKPVKIILSEDTPDEELVIEQTLRRNVPRRSELPMDKNMDTDDVSKAENSSVRAVVKEEVKQPDNTEEKKIEVVRVIESQPQSVIEETVDKKVQPERKTKLIRNPLPGPKPHVPKELNYDYEPKDSEMEFDLDDLVGKDYYDL